MMVLNMLIVFLTATIGGCHNLASIVATNLASVSGESTLTSSKTNTIATPGATTMISSRLDPTSNETSSSPPLPSNNVSKPYPTTMVTHVNTNTSVSAHIRTPPAYIYRTITIIRNSSRVSPTPAVSVVKVTPTVNIKTNSNNTEPDAFHEPRSLSVAKAWVFTIFDIVEMCHSTASTVLAIYHIRMIWRLLGVIRQDTAWLDGLKGSG